MSPRTSAAAPADTPHPPEGMTAEGERDALLAARGQSERARYLMGRHYRNIVTYRFYEALGFRSVQEFIYRCLGGEPAAASLVGWAEVAERFSLEQAEQFTCHKLVHLCAYAARAGITDLADPGAVPIEVPNPDGTFVTKPLQACTTKELERALETGSGPSKPLTELETEARELTSALAVVVGTESHAKVRVERRGRSGVLLIDNLTVEDSLKIRQAFIGH